MLATRPIFIPYNSTMKYAVPTVYFFSHGLFLVLGFGYPVLSRTGFFIRQPQAPNLRKKIAGLLHLESGQLIMPEGNMFYPMP